MLPCASLYVQGITLYLHNHKNFFKKTPLTHILSLSLSKTPDKLLLMETATFIQNSFGFSFPTSKPVSRFQGQTCYSLNSLSFGYKSSVSKKCHSLSPFNLGQRKVAGSKRLGVIRASSSDSVERDEAIAPLQLESPVGQFLTQILVSHPHLVPAAVEQQLEQLRDAEKKEDSPTSGTDLVLYRRIAEVKANERKKALEEILYALVVQKFMESNVSLLPSITPPSPDHSGQVDNWPTQDDKLKQLHSPEANDMIQNHLSLILGNRLGDSTSVAQISKLRVGQVYAASVMYGYFLKRVDQRFQLEKTMKVLGSDDVSVQQSIPEMINPIGVSPGGFGHGIKSSRLRNYVMSFDGDTLQSYATIRSKEAVTIIEKHTEALFGRQDIVISPQGTIDSSHEENIKISFGGLRRLILEAVTFGSFLWDVESYVDSRYHFVTS